MEQNLQNQNGQTQNCKSSWTDHEIDTLGKALTFCFKNSDQYGSDLDLKSRIDAFKFTLREDFSMDQILTALKTHMKKSTEMFKPAHATMILAPEKKKITQSEYIAALDWQKRNNFPAYSEAYMTIKAFEKENAENRAPLHEQPIHPSLTSRLQEAKKLEEKS